MTNFFSDIEAQYKKDLPFVVYRKPDTSELTAWLVESDTLETTVNFEEEGFVFSPFEGPSPSVVFKKSNSNIRRTAVEDLETYVSKIKVIASLNEQQHYENLVQKAIDEIRESALLKVVLSRNIKVPVSITNPLKLFKNLIQKYPNAFVYCWFHPKIGLWLGATPELLCKMTRNELTTVSLAGTIKEGSADHWTDKERQEQRLVTDYIVSQLEPVANSIQEGDLQEIKAGDLTHLKTTIKALVDVEKTGLKEVIQQLHPTPAICGFPTELAQQFIKTHETYYRSYYTGFLGEINLRKETQRSRSRRNVENQVFKSLVKASQLYVNLRCLELKDGLAHIYVGGGIVESSNPQREWQETVDKSNTMLSVL